MDDKLDDKLDYELKNITTGAVIDKFIGVITVEFIDAHSIVLRGEGNNPIAVIPHNPGFYLAVMK